mgnify:CR=1 FL=1
MRTPSPNEQKKLRVLVTVKAYPNPSKNLIEASCVAGVTEEKKLVRLYPVPFRFLDDSQQFGKYQWIEVPVQRRRSDNRPESFRPEFEKLNVLPGTLSTRNGWWERWQWVGPSRAPSLCEVQRAQAAEGTSLGFFRPEEVLDFDWERDDGNWTPGQLTTLQRKDLFLTKKGKLLEKIPLTFRYRFRCAECERGKSHHMKIVDWELMQQFRKLRRDTGSEAECLAKLKDNWLGNLCGPNKETHFFVGNMLAHPNSFLVLGVYWPNRRKTGLLL